MAVLHGSCPLAAALSSRSAARSRLRAIAIARCAASSTARHSAAVRAPRRTIS